MYIILAVISLGLIIFFHELGHAYVMRKHGVEIEEICLGLKWGVYCRWCSDYFDCPMYFSPLLIIGYVKPSGAGEQTMKSLSVRQKLEIDAAGVWANLLVGFGCLFVLVIPVLLEIMQADNFLMSRAVFVLAATIMPMVLLLAFRVQFSMYVFPALSIVVLVYIAWEVFGPSAGSDLSGPVGVANIISKYASSISSVIKLTGALSLSLGIINALPLLPLDGGRAIHNILPARFKEKFASISTLLCYSFIAWIVFNDLF